MKIIFYILFSTFITFTCAQQPVSKPFKLDSLRNKLIKDSTHTYRLKKVRPYIAIDNRNSFVQKAPINLRGFQIGIRLNEKHIIGLGYYNISPFSKNAFITKIFNDDEAKQFLNMSYFTLFYKYKLLLKKYYEINLASEAGVGDASVRLVDNNKVLLKREKIRIYPFGTGIQFVLKPLKWIGLSSMGGYRLVNEGSLHYNFNGWFYSFGVWIDVRQIYRDTKFYGFQKRKYHQEVKKVLQS
jgi:hypothetical protein